MNNNSKRVAILKETRAGEQRVILLPDQVAWLRRAGFEVLVETGAGAGSDAPDESYLAAGAEIVPRREAWLASRYVLKYKAPGTEEFDYLRADLHLGAFFHAEGSRELTDALLRSGTHAYSYEFFRTADGVFPMAVPDSEIAGKLAVLYGAFYLQSHLGGSGTLLTATPGVPRPRVLVIGYGNVGGAAARTADALGADVTVLGTSPHRLRRFHAELPEATCLLNSREVLEREVPAADLIIGTILISTYDTEPMIGEDLVRQMRPGSVIVDVTAGYGTGYLPTFDRFTWHYPEPMYERFGVLHCKIDALPASVPRTATRAVSPVIAPYLIALGKAIYDDVPDPVSAAGRITAAGQLTHPEMERHQPLLAAAGQP
jgi:alanine dehydrogenase